VVAWNGTKNGALKLKEELSTFLRDQLGLELSAHKTHITHVTKGYDFLGFTLRRYRNRSGGSDLLTRPSKTSVMKLKAKIKTMTKQGTTRDAVRDKIEAMNYLTRGWANYYRHTAASRTLRYVSHYAFKRMEGWLRNKTRQGIRTVYKEYYRRDSNGHLTWSAGGQYLHLPAYTKIERLRYAHRPNPYQTTPPLEQFPYHQAPFSARRWGGARYYGNEWAETRAKVLERDEGRCRVCGKQGKVEVHHIRPWKPGMPHELSNLVTLCLSCHRQVQDRQSEVNRRLARITP
jgi:RNA-directed DNA polymerase